MATKLDDYKLTKGETDWHNKINNALDAIGEQIDGVSKTMIFYGTDDDPNTSGWKDGNIYIRIEE